MRLLAGFEIKDSAKYLSHLDFQRALQRLLRRAGLPLMYSVGFNPHPMISYASARPVGATSDSEVVEIQLGEISETEAFAAMKGHGPPGVTCVRARLLPDGFPKLSSLVCAAGYEITLLSDMAGDDMVRRVNALLERPLIVQKKGKAGVKPLDVVPLIYERSVCSSEEGVTLKLIGAHTQEGSLPPALLAEALLAQMGLSGGYRLHRSALLARAGGGFVNILDYRL